MTKPRFYISDPLHPGALERLSAPQSRQVSQVLRMKVDDRLALFNGSGIEAEARLVEIAGGITSFEVLEVDRPDRSPPVQLTVGLAALRGDRFEVAVQKLTELGVHSIVPLSTERSVIPFNDARAWGRRLHRLQRIIIEAAEQCERVTLPEVSEPATLSEFLLQQPVIAMVERTSTATLMDIDTGAFAAIAIGPEGGWSAAEITAIEQHAAAMASLGRLILRAETAAIVAAGTIIQRAWRDAASLGK
ncbi:MAG TPA: RsmE family RNA methyltransferase [Thermomicrobiales bacterium]|nr:RsmE family RNA methyltransferase [Thermomicrobiales bacterium]